MTNLEKLQKRVIEFRDARDWQQFHRPKDLAVSMLLEAAEFLEHFQWKTSDETRIYLRKHKQDVSEELCDVLYWVLLIANDMKVDLTKEFERKMKKNEKKYPVSKAKGRHTKYTEL